MSFFLDREAQREAFWLCLFAALFLLTVITGSYWYGCSTHGLC